MVGAYNSMVQNNSNPDVPMREYGFARLGGNYFDAQPNYKAYARNAAGRGFWWGLGGATLTGGSAGIDFHTHFDPGPGNYRFGGLNSVSGLDINTAQGYVDGGVNMMMLTGSATMLYQYDNKGNQWQIAGAGWWNLNCF